MSYTVTCFIIKKTQTSLTIDDIRKKDYIAKETENGFYLVADFWSKMELIHSSKSDREDIIPYDPNSLLVFLNDHKLDPNFKIVKLTSESFGGCLDEYKISIYDDTEKKIKYNMHKLKNGMGEAENNVKKVFDIDEKESMFSFIGLSSIRENRDLISKEQKQELLDIKQKIEDDRYYEWVKIFEPLSEHERLQRIFEIVKKSDSIYRSSFNMDLDEENEFINRYFNRKD